MRATDKEPIRRLVPLRVLMWTVLASSVSMAAAEAARADCRVVARALNEAIAARDLDAVRGRFQAVLNEASCSDGFREKAGRAVSMIHARAVQERIAAGSSVASQRAVLERGLDYARTWPVLALLGDAAHDTGDYDGASARYQEALAVIDDAAKTPKAPPRSEIERIFRRAAQSRMLAADYRPAPRTRSGAPGGLAAQSIRGFVIERVPLPIIVPHGLGGVHRAGPARGGGHGGVPDRPEVRADHHCRTYRPPRRRGIQPGSLAPAGGGGRTLPAHAGVRGGGFRWWRRARASDFRSTIRTPTPASSAGRWIAGSS